MKKITNFIPLLLIIISYGCLEDSSEVIVDSHYTFEEAIKGTKAPEDLVKHLEMITLTYYSFDGKLHQGQMVTHKDLAVDIKEVFMIMQANKFPIRKVIPIVKYDWDDGSSLIDDNSSCFNYRQITGETNLSMHSLGLAIDLNPLENPYIKGGIVLPPQAVYSINSLGTFTEESIVVKEFKKRGWEWGGNWNSLKDYQHFQKNLSQMKLRSSGEESHTNHNVTLLP
ncbi:M15 family metallopeptidase [Chryseobacterium rhizoplanae]|uniref:M15 family metallopeptidase n=1 Tax=Chryseobacterium rhizoplanae TaxID=1609531 RepID=UPI001CE2503E|nr:M15 family metallopeptidase [Chryseobacterium rhizoplanae]UCA61826.1 M15 family metallopeptidase [Chryseobacterium rhizoplanae]